MPSTREPSIVMLVIVMLGTLAFSGCGGPEPGPLLAGGREVKSWVEASHDPRPQVRRHAVLKLGNVGDADPAAAKALAEALHDADPLVRSDAVLAVAKLKDPGAAIKDQLETMSRSDKNARARELAGKALARLREAE
jgi:HEAT repeat protein